MRKAGKARIAIMIDSPYHIYDQTRFSITEVGVQDVEEYKEVRDLVVIGAGPSGWLPQYMVLQKDLMFFC